MKKGLVTFLGAILFLLILLLAGYELKNNFYLIRQTNYLLIFAALVMTFISILFSCSAFYYLLSMIMGRRGDRRGIIAYAFMSNAISNLLSMGGLTAFSTRTILLKRLGVKPEHTISATLLHTYLNSLIFILIFPLGIIQLLISVTIPKTEIIEIIVSFAFLLLILLFFSMLIYSETFRSRIFRTITKVSKAVFKRDLSHHMSQIEDSTKMLVSLFKMQPRKAVIVLLIALADWGGAMLVLYLCLLSLGAHITIGRLLSGFIIGMTIGTFSFVPGGLGIQEGAMSLIFSQVGVEFHVAIIAAILFRLIYTIIPFVLSIFYLNIVLHVKGLGG